MKKIIPLVVIGVAILGAAPSLARETAKGPVPTDRVAARHGQFIAAPVYLPERTPIAAPAYRWSLEAGDRASSPTAGGAVM